MAKAKHYYKRVIDHYGRQDEHAIIITVEVMPYQAGLMADEAEKIVDYLTDNAMHAIQSAPYTRAPLNKIRVRSPRK